LASGKIDGFFYHQATAATVKNEDSGEASFFASQSDETIESHESTWFNAACGVTQRVV
jgi:hypothetical protein